MADEDLQARLESHSKAFEGLMSLIPAKYYYGEDNQDQWQRKKQTKDEKRAAKKAKLDPASNKSALDVHKEKELKRKRELEVEDAEVGDRTGLEQPREGLKGSKKLSKKQKLNDDAGSAPSAPAVEDKPIGEDEAAKRRAYVEKRKLKRDRKRTRIAKKREKKEGKSVQLDEVATDDAKVDKTKTKPKSKPKSKLKDAKAPTQKEVEAESDDEDLEIDDTAQLDVDGIDEDSNEEDVDGIDKDSKEEDVDGIDNDSNDEDDGSDDGNVEAPKPNKLNITGIEEDAQSSTSDNSTPGDDSPTFDNLTEHSSASSTSSIHPPLEPEPFKSSKQTTQQPTFLDQPEDTPTEAAQPYEKPPKLPQIDPKLLQERLQARLAALRAARKADGLDGKPARNRQELIEARRRKQEQRKAHKKELRAKAKLEQDAETEAARLRGGSGSPMWSPGAFSPREPENNFSFGRVAFEDGAQMDASLSNVLDPRKKKGPQDVRTALEAAEKKRARINGFDEGKRADIEEKDRWLNARKRINGEKIRDDTSLLKKTLKRKDKGKTKSEKEWTERTEGVQKGKEMRQKKREENLKKRKEGKGGKGGKGKSKGKPVAAKKKRPGFEGTFKSGARLRA